MEEVDAQLRPIDDSDAHDQCDPQPALPQLDAPQP
jgi:hypothetical protein